MSSEFERDDEWQSRLAFRFLDPYYRAEGYQIERYHGSHPMQKLHVDVRLKHGITKLEHWLDEKLIRGLRKGGPAEKINLETWSCSIPGLERLGWADINEPSKATTLLVSHAEEVCDFGVGAWLRVNFLDCVSIPARPLRAWFAEQDHSRWKEVHNEQRNRSIARAVPIDEIMNAITGARRFRIDKPDTTDLATCVRAGMEMTKWEWMCRVPADIRAQYWKDTDRGTRPPSPQMAEAVRAVLNRML